MEYNPQAQGKIDKIIDINYEKWITQSIKKYLTIQQNLGITPPIFVILTLLGIKGIFIGQRTIDLTPLSEAFPFTQDDIILPEIIFSDFDNSVVEQQMRQVFDIVLNAASLTRGNIR